MSIKYGSFNAGFYQKPIRDVKIKLSKSCTKKSTLHVKMRQCNQKKYVKSMKTNHESYPNKPNSLTDWSWKLWPQSGSLYKKQIASSMVQNIIIACTIEYLSIIKHNVSGNCPMLSLKLVHVSKRDPTDFCLYGNPAILSLIYLLYIIRIQHRSIQHQSFQYRLF